MKNFTLILNDNQKNMICNVFDGPLNKPKNLSYYLQLIKVKIMLFYLVITNLNINKLMKVSK